MVRAQDGVIRPDAPAPEALPRATQPGGVKTGKPGESHEKSDKPKSDRIRAQVELTRSEIDQTVNALEGRLSAQNVVDQVIDMFRTGKVGNSRFLRAIRDNPFPSALAGAGLIWLLAEGIREKPRYYAKGEARTEYEEEGVSVSEKPAEGGETIAGTGERAKEKIKGKAGEMKDRAAEAVGGMKERISEKVEHAKEKLSGKKEELSEKGGSFKDRARGMASSIKDRTSEAVGTAKDRATEMASGLRGKAKSLRSGARDRAGQVRRGFRHTFEDHPLAVGAAMASAGVLAGLLLPRTRTEDELMGERRDQLAGAAEDTGATLVQKGSEVAERVMEAAHEEAGRQETTDKDIVGKAADVVQTAAETGKEEAKKQDLTPEGVAAAAEQAAKRDIHSPDVPEEPYRE